MVAHRRLTPEQRRSAREAERNEGAEGEVIRGNGSRTSWVLLIAGILGAIAALVWLF